MACEQLTAKHHTTTNSGTKREQHHIGTSLGCTFPGLTHKGTVAIVGERDAALQSRLQPIRQRHLLPPRQVDAHPGNASRRIHRPRQTDPHHRCLSSRVEPLDRFADRHADGTGHGRLRRRDLVLRQELTLAIKASQLDRRAAEVDSDHLIR